MGENWLSNRIFRSFDDIVDHCWDAWNKIIDQPWRVMSLVRRKVTALEKRDLAICAGHALGMPISTDKEAMFWHLGLEYSPGSSNKNYSDNLEAIYLFTDDVYSLVVSYWQN
jgi:hypothetical protein